MAKQYAAAENYEAKLEKVMKRLGVDQFNYDWSRFECWVEFWYQGQYYRFQHGVENARAHGQNIRYGSDAFAQMVLTLEDIARMTERGIYELQTWISGLKALPPAPPVDACFIALGFETVPDSKDAVKFAYKRLAKVAHPDSGGSSAAFESLKRNYEKCMEIMDVKQ